MLTLKAEELYFLGRYMNAQYIDYDYVQLMEDIQNNYSLKEKEIIADLVDRDVLMEDFSGDIEIDEDIENILKPIFFGFFESSMNHYIIRGSETEIKENYRFHYLDGFSTVVEIKDKYLNVSGNAEDILKNLFKRIVPSEYQGDSKEIPVSQIKQGTVSEVLILRNIMIGQQEYTGQLCKAGGIWYEIRDNETAEAMPGKKLMKRWEEALGSPSI